ncbi:hypothetical protein AB4172_03305 [Vibrio splendidus]
MITPERREFNPKESLSFSYCRDATVKLIPQSFTHLKNILCHSVAVVVCQRNLGCRLNSNKSRYNTQT